MPPPIVRGRTAYAALHAARLSGLSPARILEGLGHDATTLRASKYVPWDTYAVIVERIEEMAGGAQAGQDLAQEAYHRAVPEVRALAGVLLSPRTLLKVIVEVIDPIAMPAVEFVYEDAGVDRARVIQRLPPGARPCAAFFRLSIGALRGFPGHLDLPPAIVDAEVGPSEGTYHVEMPPSRSLVSRGRRVTRAALEIALARFAIGLQDDKRAIRPTGEATALEAVGHAWELTPRQRDVLKLLARGLSNKEIAVALDCAESTVELHVTHLLRKSEVSSRAQLIARFWASAS
jgi:DNA-binding CsgD family transcriptional regulator